MQVSETNKIQGLVPEVPGIIYGQYDRLNELNDRIKGRQFSDQPLQPNYDPRPVPTKYSHFPIIERRKTAAIETPLAKYLDYSPETNFAPISGKGTVDGFLRNVNTESTLRNQYFALSNANQRYYIPSSNSDLYRDRPVAGSLNEQQPYPYLFDKPSSFESYNVVEPEVGSLTFFNDTRSQLRGNGF